MKKQFVPYEIAMKCKEKGFDEECFGWWNYKDDLNYNYPPYKKEHFDDDMSVAPTYQQVTDWLREEHKIFICVDMMSFGGYYVTVKNVDDPNMFIYTSQHETLDYYDALERGINKSLEKI